MYYDHPFTRSRANFLLQKRAHFAAQKLSARFPGSCVNERRIRASFCLFKIYPDPIQRGEWVECGG